MMLEHGLVGAEPDVGVTRPSRVLVRSGSRVLDSPTTVPPRVLVTTCISVRVDQNLQIIWSARTDLSADILVRPDRFI